MPSLGADMDRGTLLEWLVSPGDVVAKGDIVAVVDTEKSDIEVEVFESGVVAELLVGVGEEVPVGTPLARIESSATGRSGTRALSPDAGPAPQNGAMAAETAVAAAPAPVLEGPPRGAPTTAQTAGRVLSPLVRHLAEERHLDLSRLRGTGPGGVVTRHDVEAAGTGPAVGLDEGRLRASPLARRLARDAGVDLAAVTGSGPSGAVLAADLRDAGQGAPSASGVRGLAPDAGSVPRKEGPDGMRRVIANAMARSKREIPHYYLQTTIDMAAALDWLRARNEERPVTERILPVALLLKATAVTAAEHPELNGHWEGGHRPSSAVHLGVAIALRGGGLVAPGIEGADQRSLDELMAALRDLTKRARAGRLRQSEWTGPTITVTNLGDLGVESVWGVINPPQLAMVGFGAVRDAVVAVDGSPVVRPVVQATLAADHRTSDGIQGAAFLAAIDRRLHDPGALAPGEPERHHVHPHR